MNRTHRSYRSLVVLGSASFVLSIAEPVPAQQSPASACYDLSIGPWSPRLNIGQDSIELGVPTRIELGSAMLERGRRTFVVRTAPRAVPSVHSSNRWVMLGPDSAQLVFSTGFAGVIATVTSSGNDRYTGTARSFWDFDRPAQTAEFIADGVPCDDPLRPEQEARYEYLRGIAVAGGDSIRIGEPVGVEAVRPPGSSWASIQVRAAAPFAEAESIRVRLGPTQVVNRIELLFQPSANRESVMERLISTLGAPTSSSESGATWLGRMSWVQIHEAGDGDPKGFIVQITSPVLR